MARLEYVKTSFTKGVITPRAHGRIDLEGFFDGAKRLENQISVPWGGSLRRSGFRFVAKAKFPDRDVRILDFEFSVLQTYIIETGDLYMRFFSNEGQLIASTVSASITNGDFDAGITGWTDNSAGGGTISFDTGGDGGRMALDVTGGGNAAGEQAITITEASTDHQLAFSIQDTRVPRNADVEVTIGTASGLADIFTGFFKVGDHVITFNPGATSPVFLQFNYDSATAPNVNEVFIDNVKILSNEPVEIDCKYTETDIDELGFTQSADIMFIANPRQKPTELRRTGPNDFSQIEHDYLDGPYQPINQTDTTITVGGTSGLGTITFSSLVGLPNGGLTSDDVGRTVRAEVRTGGGWTWMEILTVTSPTTATVFIRGDNATGGADTNWRLGEWFGPVDYPQVTTFHEERLFWAHITQQSQSIWGSKSADFNNHEPTNPADDVVADDNALNNTVASNTVNAVSWLVSGENGMLVGTNNGIFLYRPSSNTKGLAPDNITIERKSAYGSDEDIKPVLINKSAVFVQRGGQEIREASFDTQFGTFVSNSLSILAENLIRLGADRMAYAQSPVPIVWVVANGKLEAFTVDAQQKVLAWHSHPFGQSAAGGGTIEDIAVIPEGREDQVWGVFKRTINGVEQRSIEFQEGIFTDDQPIEDAFYVDSALTGVFGTPTVTITGLDHLEGEEVAILADGAVRPSATVSGGSITLDTGALKVHVGLATRGLIELLPYETGIENITSIGKIKGPHEVFIKVDNTVGGRIGPDEDNTDEILFRDASVPMNTPVQPFTGTKKAFIEHRWERDITTVLLNDQPLPFHILQVVVELEMNES